MNRDKLAKQIYKEIESVVPIVNKDFKRLYIEAIKMGLKRGGV